MKFLVPVDNSVGSAQVLPFVTTLADTAGATITLLTVCKLDAEPSDVQLEVAKDTGVGVLVGPGVHVTEPVAREPLESRDQVIASSVSEASNYLSTLARPLEEKGILVAKRVVVASDVVGVLISMVKDEAFDMIAMSTHGRAGLDEMVRGSVARSVLRSGVAPVLMVRPQEFRG